MRWLHRFYSFQGYEDRERVLDAFGEAGWELAGVPYPIGRGTTLPNWCGVFKHVMPDDAREIEQIKKDWAVLSRRAFDMKL